MNPFKRAVRHIKESIAEYYTLFVIVLAVPAAISLLVGYEWAVLLSFVSQAVIGVLYIRGSNK